MQRCQVPSEGGQDEVRNTDVTDWISVSISDVDFSAIDDSLTVVMHVEKQDQKGKDTAPKHIFANPVRPWLCCVLALAVYVFTMGPRRPGAKMLVFGKDAAACASTTFCF